MVLKPGETIGDLVVKCVHRELAAAAQPTLARVCWSETLRLTTVGGPWQGLLASSRTFGATMSL